jgi:1-acyl-sn-glycerol-3-phosphate acyltransferase
MIAPPDHRPPTADEIERRFRSPAVVITRPLILTSLKVLKTVRRYGWETDGLARLAAIDGPFILAANHNSHVDTEAILGSLPRHARRRTAVAAALDVFGTSSKGRTLRNECLQLMVASGFHAFAFDRHGPPLRSLRTSVQLIRNGWNLLLYPEGTRSRTGEIGQFKSGIGVLARFTGRPVVPVHVDGGQRVHPYGNFIPGPGRMKIRYGAPVLYREGETPADFTQRLRDHVLALRAGVAADAAPHPASEAPLGSQVAGS